MPPPDADRNARSSRAWRRAKAQVFAAQRVCHLCGRRPDFTKTAPHPDSPSVDHVEPVSHGGALTARANLKLACLGCNKRKGTRARPAEPRPSREW